MPPYNILLIKSTLQQIIEYKTELQENKTDPGTFLKSQLDSWKKGLEETTTENFIQLLLSTKKIMFLAKRELKGDGSDWNHTELKILGDISVAMEVEVYDNGVWSSSEKRFKVHNTPFPGVLLFTPGPLLHANKCKGSTPDFEEIFDSGQIDQDKYTKMIERRLLPLFLYASEHAKDNNKNALVVLPGIGCGLFAGKFKGKMGEFLNRALQAILKSNGGQLTNLACVRYDPYNECADFEKTFHSVKYRVRKLIGPLGKPQLSTVKDLEEIEDEFENCTLYKIVAWDHGSLPGNNFFKGSRNTDDGVVAAATNSMEVVTGVKGSYSKGKYLPPTGNEKWMSVAEKQRTILIADGNVKIATPNGLLLELSQFEAKNSANV